MTQAFYAHMNNKTIKKKKMISALREYAFQWEDNINKYIGGSGRWWEDGKDFVFQKPKEGRYEWCALAMGRVVRDAWSWRVDRDFIIIKNFVGHNRNLGLF
jgi:hypothetical protein